MNSKDKYVPKIGDYLCLTKRSNDQRLPYIVIDVTEDKLAIQQCDIIKDNLVKHNTNGMIVLLSWSKEYGWCWKSSRWDEDPEIAIFYK